MSVPSHRIFPYLLPHSLEPLSPLLDPLRNIAPDVNASPNPSIWQTKPDKGSNTAVGHWTSEEHQRFLDALDLYGKDWKLIQKYIGTRSIAQTRSHAQKYFNKVREKSEGRAGVHRSRRRRRTSVGAGRGKRERPRKTKPEYQREYSVVTELETNSYFNNLEERIFEKVNHVNIESFSVERQEFLPEHIDPLDLDFAMLPRLSNLMHAECESDFRGRLPWDMEVAADYFPKLLLPEETDVLFPADEKDFTDYMSVQTPQSFARLFNT